MTKEYNVTFITRVYQIHLIEAPNKKEALKKAKAELDDSMWHWDKGHDTYIEQA